jgi:hypothetical protein
MSERRKKNKGDAQKRVEEAQTKTEQKKVGLRKKSKKREVVRGMRLRKGNEELPEGKRVGSRIVERNQHRRRCDARRENDQSTESKRNSKPGEPALLVQVLLGIGMNLIDHRRRKRKGKKLSPFRFFKLSCPNRFLRYALCPRERKKKKKQTLEIPLKKTLKKDGKAENKNCAILKARRMLPALCSCACFL